MVKCPHLALGATAATQACEPKLRPGPGSHSWDSALGGTAATQACEPQLRPRPGSHSFVPTLGATPIPCALPSALPSALRACYCALPSDLPRVLPSVLPCAFPSAHTPWGTSGSFREPPGASGSFREPPGASGRVLAEPWAATEAPTKVRLPRLTSAPGPGASSFFSLKSAIKKLILRCFDSFSRSGAFGGAIRTR